MRKPVRTTDKLKASCRELADSGLVLLLPESRLEHRLGAITFGLGDVRRLLGARLIELRLAVVARLVAGIGLAVTLRLVVPGFLLVRRLFSRNVEFGFAEL